jgi:diketogulonate reductase-like aldo/keto reductase
MKHKLVSGLVNFIGLSELDEENLEDAIDQAATREKADYKK